MKPNVLILCFALIIGFFLILWSYFHNKKIFEPLSLQKIIPRIPLYQETDGKIPKIIWTFWDSNKLPVVVAKCVETWRKTNPDYDIHIVTKDNLSFYLPNNKIFSYPHCGENNIQRASDFIRLELIYKYGGFWVDASILLNGSLDYFRDIQEKNKYEFVGYYLEGFTSNKNYPVIESWFFGAIKHSQIIKIWLLSFSHLNSFSAVEDYIRWLQTQQNVDTQKINGLSYLSIHVACQFMLQKKLTQNQIQNLIYLEKAEDGPFKYLEESNWNSKDALLNACKQKDLQTLVFKMRGYERKLIAENPELMCIFQNLN